MSSSVLNTGEMIIKERIRPLKCSLLLERERKLSKVVDYPELLSMFRHQVVNGKANREWDEM